MNPREQRLEEVSKMISSYKIRKHVPIFEVYVTVFSIIVAIMLFWLPDMLHSARGFNNKGLYWLMLSIMPQFMWAFTFFIAGLIKAVGLLIDNSVLRIIGLSMSALLYLVFTICHGINFPNIGMINFFCMTLFAAVSIVTVKQTSISSEK